MSSDNRHILVGMMTHEESQIYLSSFSFPLLAYFVSAREENDNHCVRRYSRLSYW